MNHDFSSRNLFLILTIRHLAILAVLIGFWSPGYAQISIFNLEEAGYISDEKGVFSAADIVAMPASNFMRPEQPAIAFSTQFPTWVRFRIPEDTLRVRYLHFSLLTDSVMLYRQDSLVGITGTDVSDEGIFLRGQSRYYFSIPSSGGTYLLRLSAPTKSYEVSNTAPILIQLVGSRTQLEKLIADRRKGKGDNGQRWFLASIFVILLLVVASWRLLGHRIFGHYAIYVGMVFVYYFVRKLSVLGYEGFYLRSFIRGAFELISFPLVFFFYARFIKAFLEAGKDLLSFHLKIVMRAALIACGLIAGGLAFWGVYWGGMLALLCRILLAAYACVIVVLLLRRKDRNGRLIAAGAMVLLAGFILIIVNNLLKSFYDLDLEPGPLSFMQYAVFGELVFYWLVLVYTVRDLREEYTRNALALAEAELERKALAEQLAAMAQKKELQRVAIITPRREYILARTQVQGFVANGEVCTCLLAEGKTETIPLRLGELEKQLPPGFFRAHRSYIVDASKVIKTVKGEPNMVFLSGLVSGVPLGKGKYAELRRLLDLDSMG